MAKRKSGDTKKGVRLVALILCILLAGSAVVSALITVAYGQEEKKNTTQITLTMDEGAQEMRAFQITRYQNKTGKEMNQLLFSLGANSLNRLATVPYEEGDLEKAYPLGFNGGGVIIDSVTVNGEKARWGFQGQGETFIRVKCKIMPGETGEFAFSYRVLVPSSNAFVGEGDMGWRLAFFSPAPCVYEEKDFVCLEPSFLGENNYFERQDFSVTVDTPKSYIVIGGGEAKEEQRENGRKKTTFSLENASSLAMAIGRRYSLYSEKQDGLEINCYANTNTGGKRALKYAKQITNVFYEKIGPLPFDTLSVVQTDGVRDEEAYDGLIMVEKELFSLKNGEKLEKALCRGIAKQYISLGIQINPEKYPWLTDALADYLYLLYSMEQYGEEKYLKRLNEISLDSLKITLPGGLRPDGERNMFSSSYTYDIIVKGRGCAVLHQVRETMGSEAMWRALSIYCEEAKKQGGGRDIFLKALESARGRDMSKALENYMDTIWEYVNENPEYIF